MSRQDANAAFALTSFLYGGNAAYVEELYARYEADPKAVDAEWRAFFQSLKDDARDVAENARGPSWRRPGWPPTERNELVAALDGDWAEIGKALGGKVKAQAQTKGVELAAAEIERATRDSIRALMLIRAYRVRGHFHANLDPLGLRTAAGPGGARPASLRLRRSRSRPADLSRQRARARIRHDARRSSPSCSAPTARRSAWSSCTSPTAHKRAGCRSASRVPTRRSASPARASAPSSTS